MKIKMKNNLLYAEYKVEDDLKKMLDVAEKKEEAPVNEQKKNKKK
jgi:hypothetical protein